MATPVLPHIKGVDLSEQFYLHSVLPILQSKFPNVFLTGKKFSAALFGHGSESLGYDTAMSQDHDFGPRLLLFLSKEDHAALAPQIDETLKQELPLEFMGFSTHFEIFDDHVSVPPATIPAPQKREEFKLQHKVEILTVEDYFETYLGIDLVKQNFTMSLRDWLSIPSQKLLAVTSGRVFFDGLKTLTAIREVLKYYPVEIWYLLYVQFSNISQQVAFVGRTGSVQDELGSQVVTAIIVQDIMKLCFMLEKKYFPYSKWFGTAFRVQLESGKKLYTFLTKVMSSPVIEGEQSWKKREQILVQVYAELTSIYNKTVLPSLQAIDPSLTEVNTKESITQFHERPFQILNTGPFQNQLVQALQKLETQDAAAMLAKIRSKTTPYVGAIDQYCSQVDIMESPTLYLALGKTAHLL